MKKIGIFYGSSTGNTEQAAKKIAQKIGVDPADIIDVGNSKVAASKLQDYELLLFGSSTWGAGDLQDDWDGFITQLTAQNLAGKMVAVFGTGDSSTFSDTFCDSLGIIAQAAKSAGAQIVGQGVDVEEYNFDSSEAVIDGAFCGLALDEENEDDKTDDRIDRWVTKLKIECGI